MTRESNEQLIRHYIVTMIDALKEEISDNRVSSYEYQFFKNCLISALQYLENTSVERFNYGMPNIEVSEEELKEQFPDKAEDAV